MKQSVATQSPGQTEQSLIALPLPPSGTASSRQQQHARNKTVPNQTELGEINEQIMNDLLLNRRSSCTSHHQQEQEQVVTSAASILRDHINHRSKTTIGASSCKNASRRQTRFLESYLSSQLPLAPQQQDQPQTATRNSRTQQQQRKKTQQIHHSKDAEQLKQQLQLIKNGRYTSATSAQRFKQVQKAKKPVLPQQLQITTPIAKRQHNDQYSNINQNKRPATSFSLMWQERSRIKSGQRQKKDEAINTLNEGNLDFQQQTESTSTALIQTMLRVCKTNASVRDSIAQICGAQIPDSCQQQKPRPVSNKILIANFQQSIDEIQLQNQAEKQTDGTLRVHSRDRASRSAIALAELNQSNGPESVNPDACNNILTPQYHLNLLKTQNAKQSKAGHKSPAFQLSSNMAIPDSMLSSIIQATSVGLNETQPDHQHLMFEDYNKLPVQIKNKAYQRLLKQPIFIQDCGKNLSDLKTNPVLNQRGSQALSPQVVAVSIDDFLRARQAKLKELQQEEGYNMLIGTKLKTMFDVQNDQNQFPVDDLQEYCCNEGNTPTLHQFEYTVEDTATVKRNQSQESRNAGIFASDVKTQHFMTSPKLKNQLCQSPKTPNSLKQQMANQDIAENLKNDLALQLQDSNEATFLQEQLKSPQHKHHSIAVPVMASQTQQTQQIGTQSGSTFHPKRLTEYKFTVDPQFPQKSRAQSCISQTTAITKLLKQQMVLNNKRKKQNTQTLAFQHAHIQNVYHPEQVQQVQEIQVDCRAVSLLQQKSYMLKQTTLLLQKEVSLATPTVFQPLLLVPRQSSANRRSDDLEQVQTVEASSVNTGAKASLELQHQQSSAQSPQPFMRVQILSNTSVNHDEPTPVKQKIAVVPLTRIENQTYLDFVNGVNDPLSCTAFSELSQMNSPVLNLVTTQTLHQHKSPPSQAKEKPFEHRKRQSEVLQRESQHSRANQTTQVGGGCHSGSNFAAFQLVPIEAFNDTAQWQTPTDCISAGQKTSKLFNHQQFSGHQVKLNKQRVQSAAAIRYQQFKKRFEQNHGRNLTYKQRFQSTATAVGSPSDKLNQRKHSEPYSFGGASSSGVQQLYPHRAGHFMMSDHQHIFSHPTLNQTGLHPPLHVDTAAAMIGAKNRDQSQNSDQTPTPAPAFTFLQRRQIQKV